jgi:predicted ester cyclase
MSPEQNKELVARFFEEVWNRGNFQFMDEIYSPDFVLHALWQNLSAGGSGDVPGIEPAKKVIGGWRHGLPDLVMTVEEQVAEGDIVVTRHHATGTQTNEFMGIPPTNKGGTISGITFTRIDGGKVVEAWTMWDIFGALQLMGLIPPMGTKPGPQIPPGRPDQPRTASPIAPLARRLYEDVLSQGRLEMLAETLDPAFAGNWPGTENVRGPGGMREIVSQMRTGFPDLTFKVEDQFGDAEKVVTHYTIRGTQHGHFWGITPTGKSVVVAGIGLSRVSGNRIVEQSDEWDRRSLLEQVGAVPPLG